MRKQSAHVLGLAIALAMSLGSRRVIAAEVNPSPIMDHLYGGVVQEINSPEGMAAKPRFIADRYNGSESLPEIQEIPVPGAFSMGLTTFAIFGGLAGFRKLKQHLA